MEYYPPFGAHLDIPKSRQPPTPPEKDEKLTRMNGFPQEQTPYNMQHNMAIPDPNMFDENLPPAMDPQSYQQGRKPSHTSLQSTTSKQKRLEHDLIHSVMNRPLISIPAGHFIGLERYQEKRFTIATNYILYLFEIFFGIAVITLAAILIGKDPQVGKGLYQYFIADSSVSLAVALLFITTVINFEERNGSFYCVAATLMKIASFIMITSHIIPMDCLSLNICGMRKALSALLIISTFLWVANLTMFLTTLYISRLNLLDDINFDFSEKGVQKKFNEPLPEPSIQRELTDPETGQPLREFYLNENGEMYEIDDTMDVKGKNKIIVYTF